MSESEGPTSSPPKTCNGGETAGGEASESSKGASGRKPGAQACDACSRDTYQDARRGRRVAISCTTVLSTRVFRNVLRFTKGLRSAQQAGGSRSWLMSKAGRPHPMFRLQQLSTTRKQKGRRRERWYFRKWLGETEKQKERRREGWNLRKIHARVCMHTYLAVPQQDVAVSVSRGLCAQAVASEMEHRRQQVQLPPSLVPQPRSRARRREATTSARNMRAWRTCTPRAEFARGVAAAAAGGEENGMGRLPRHAKKPEHHRNTRRTADTRFACPLV